MKPNKRDKALKMGQRITLNEVDYKVLKCAGNLRLLQIVKTGWNQQQKHDWAVEILDQNTWQDNVEFFHAGHTTIAVAHGECGIAKFMPNGSDHFDRVIGRAIALCRLFEIDLPSEIEED